MAIVLPNWARKGSYQLPHWCLPLPQWVACRPSKSSYKLGPIEAYAQPVIIKLVRTIYRSNIVDLKTISKEFKIRI